MDGQHMNCPRCSQNFSGHPAISRRDNKTEICSDCGTSEAMNDFSDFYSIPMEERINELVFQKIIDADFDKWKEAKLKREKINA
mgnify:CR=1 FL=1